MTELSVSFEGSIANSIPIRTWSRGKTWNEESYFDEDDANSDYVSIEGDLLGYFPQEPNEDEVLKDDVAEGVVEDDISGAFEEYCREHYSANVLPTRELQQLMSAYEFEKVENEVSAMYSPEKVKNRLPSQPRLDMDIFNPTFKYHVDNDDNYTADAIDGTRTPSDDDSADYRMRCDSEPDHIYKNSSYHQLPYDYVDIAPTLSSKATTKTSAFFNGKKVKTSGYGPVNQQKKRQEMIWRDRHRSFDAQAKLRDQLSEIALKKKIDEELATLNMMKDEARKRKMKEQIEKSMQARVQVEPGMNTIAIPSFLAPTKAFELQASSNLKPRNEPVMTSEEMLRVEEERREHVAAVRRKFKERHRSTLENLTKKNKDKERKVEEEHEIETKKKEKYHRKLLRMIQDASERQVDDNDEYDDDDHDTEDIESAIIDHHIRVSSYAEHKPCSNKQHIHTPTANADDDTDTVDDRSTTSATANLDDESPASISMKRDTCVAPIVPDQPDMMSSLSSSPRNAAGSGLAAIRSNRISPRATTVNHTAAVAAVPSYEAFFEAEEEKQQSQQKRHVTAKLQQEKIQGHLAAIAEHRKKVEIEKKQKEDRIKRRAYLVRVRIMAETAERKAMAGEDKVDEVEEVDEVPRAKHTIDRQKSNVLTIKSSQQQPSLSNETITIEADEKVFVAKRKDKASYHVQVPDNHDEHHTTSHDEVSSKPSPHVTAAAITPSAGGNQQQKLSSHMKDAMIQRLTKSTATKPSATITTLSGEEVAISSAHYRDYNDWKRKNNIPIDTQVFCMTGWYPCVRQALLDRGWMQNSDPNSPYCDLKWTLKSIDIAQDQLQSWQLTNHFCKNMAITTKAGLLKSLQPLQWVADIAVTDIFPRGYDLSLVDDMQAFIDDFRIQHVAMILKKIYYDVTGMKNISSLKADDNVKSPTSSRRLNPESSPPSPLPTSSHPIVPVIDINTYYVNIAVLYTCCRVLERMLQPLDDAFLDVPTKSHDHDVDDHIMITALEWELISQHDVHKASKLADKPSEAVDGFLHASSSSTKHLSSKRAPASESSRSRSNAAEMVQQLVPLSTANLIRIANILSSLAVAEGSQGPINGTGYDTKNLWIVKPAAKSRGRGIMTFNELPKLLRYVEAGSGLVSQWIVQKYIENPMLIAQRKFDLRQWVLVTDWNPLTVYFYDEFYARFSVDEYDTHDQGLENCYIHLVNNSIGKNSENFNKAVETEYGQPLDGYMLSHDDFSSHVKQKSGNPDIMHQIQHRLKEIAKWSLMCASDMIEHRKNSWELYGFDFMIDDDYKPWLIEINSSPACDYSTGITERYVQKALVEILAVVLDLRKWEATPKKQRGDKPNVGGWECIYRGLMLDKPLASLGADMTLKGESYRIPHHISSYRSPQPKTSSVPSHHDHMKKSSSSSGHDDDMKMKIHVTSNIHPNQSSPSDNHASTPPVAINTHLDINIKRRGSADAAMMKEFDAIAADASSASSSYRLQLTAKHDTSSQQMLHDDDMNDSDDDLPEHHGRASRKTKPASSLLYSDFNNDAGDSASMKKMHAKKSKIPTPISTKAVPLKMFQVDF